MSMLMQRLLSPYMDTADDGDTGGAGGGAADRGDDFTPGGDDDKKAAGDGGDDKKADGEDDDKGGDDKKADGEDDDKGGDDKKADGEDDDKDGEDDEKREREKRIRIPKWRYDEAVSRARAREESLQARIQDLESEIAAGPSKKEAETAVVTLEKKLSDLDDKYDAYIADGDKERAAEVRRERRIIERQLYNAEVDSRTVLAKEQAKQELKYESALSKVEIDFPQLNPDDEDNFDPELAQDVAGMRDSLIQRGMTPATALERAVARLIGPAKKAATSVRDDVKAERERKAREAAAAAAGKTPPKLDKVGIDSDKAGGGGSGPKSVMLMSQDEFAKLSDEQRASMRGDVL